MNQFRLIEQYGPNRLFNGIPLFLIGFKYSDAKVINEFISKNANLSLTDKKGRNYLHYLAKRKDLYINILTDENIMSININIEVDRPYLFNRGVDYKQRNALTCAINKNNKQLTKLLLLGIDKSYPYWEHNEISIEERNDLYKFPCMRIQEDKINTQLDFSFARLLLLNIEFEGREFLLRDKKKKEIIEQLLPLPLYEEIIPHLVY